MIAKKTFVPVVAVLNKKGGVGKTTLSANIFRVLFALHACTHILVPVRPDRFSMLGLEILSEFVDSLPSLSPKPQIFVVLNGIRRGGHDSVANAVEAELRAHPKFAPRTLVNVVPETG